ncbi:Isotrichodermin C-15 hydroxylase [Cyphellophora attinorum]|uniref:Isotrichodermin C-15 hydroxylase n=1 Tax=Cyphellophora attinorum TaxID=1664694 RepID=A0A0N1HSX7_9EURO|nr:Isotrichodermin C-15 hydroxylase [Phialophora attinorum]KPI41872.1 Isotrichodermin C-15 hydroxylase [Phialophora attinorum]
MLINNLSEASLYGLVAVLIFLTARTVYRLTIHPLAKYPGPFLSKITSLPVYLQAITGDRHLIQLQEHRKYGSIVRIAPNQLSFSDPAALRTIYQSGRGNNPLRKSPWYETIDAPSGAYSLHTEISRTKHATKRKVIEGAFADSALRELEPFVVANVTTLVSLLANDQATSDAGDMKGRTAAWSKSKNMSDLATWFAYDVMGDLVFGQRFDCMTSAEHRFVPRLLMSSSAFVYPIAHLPFQFLIRPIISSPTLMSLFGGQLAKDEHAYVEYANNQVTDRISRQSAHDGNQTKIQRKDVMHYILEAPTAFTRTELDAESSLLIAAGADTTSTTLAAALFYLTLQSSAAYLRMLTEELRSKFSTIDSMTGIQLSPTAIPLLRAVIEETLRLSPSVPTHLGRLVVQRPGLAIPASDGTEEFVPTGTIVGAAAYVVHRDPSAFPYADEFRPERWLPADSSAEKSLLLQNPEQVALAKTAFCAFSLGSRGCVGKSLAYLELSLALARIIWSYNIRRAQAVEIGNDVSKIGEERRARGWQVSDDEYQLVDRFLAERDGPWLQFQARTD